MDNHFPADLLTAGIDRMGRDFDETVRTDYSGRGMYGATCFGLVDDSPFFLAMLAVELCREVVDNTSDDYETGDTVERDEQLDMITNLMDSARGDSMGRSAITYFPGWTLAD